MTSADIFSQPSGESIHVLHSGAETGGAYFEFDAVLPAGCSGPPAHRHRVEEESFEVLEGRVSVRLGDTWREIGVGERVVVPSGTVHAFANRTRREARMRARETPAGQLEPQLRLLARSGRIPPLLAMAALNVEHDLSFSLAGLPERPQRLLWRALARTSRLLP